MQIENFCENVDNSEKNSYLQSALYILNKINNTGQNAYIVGGFVRDFLILNNSKQFLIPSNSDIDIASPLSPDEIISLFDKTVKTGYDYGTVTIIVNGYSFEHTSFRKDLEYLKNSRRAVVSYSKSLEEDICRRDFTINTIAMDVNGKIYDFLGGMDELEDGLIKAVGNAELRFNEDALRKLRAIRFSAQTGFEIECETLRAIKSNPCLYHVSKERIQGEIKKILASDFSRKGIEILEDTGMLDEIFPGINSKINFHELNLDKKIQKMRILIENYCYRPLLRKKAVRRWIKKIGEENIEIFLAIFEIVDENYTEKLNNIIEEINTQK